MEEITRQEFFILEGKLKDGKLPIPKNVKKEILPDSSIIYQCGGERYLMDMRGVCYFVKKGFKKFIRRK